MFKSLIPAAIAVFMALSPAQALPVASAASMAVTTQSDLGTTLVADRNNNGRPDRFDRNRGGRNVYTPGRRYNSAPNGWNRYGNRRPGNWRSRRCIMVGPIWFCP